MQRLFGATWRGVLVAVFITGCGDSGGNDAMRIRACANALGSLPGVGNAASQGLPELREDVQRKCREDASFRDVSTRQWACARAHIRGGVNYRLALERCE